MCWWLEVREYQNTNLEQHTECFWNILNSKFWSMMHPLIDFIDFLWFTLILINLIANSLWMNRFIDRASFRDMWLDGIDCHRFWMFLSTQMVLDLRRSVVRIILEYIQIFLNCFTGGIWIVNEANDANDAFSSLVCVDFHRF